MSWSPPHPTVFPRRDPVHTTLPPLFHTNPFTHSLTPQSPALTPLLSFPGCLWAEQLKLKIPLLAPCPSWSYVGVTVVHRGALYLKRFILKDSSQQLQGYILGCKIISVYQTTFPIPLTGISTDIQSYHSQRGRRGRTWLWAGSSFLLKTKHQIKSCWLLPCGFPKQELSSPHWKKEAAPVFQ